MDIYFYLCKILNNILLRSLTYVKRTHLMHILTTGHKNTHTHTHTHMKRSLKMMDIFSTLIVVMVS
jgi:hypothetical protein